MDLLLNILFIVLSLLAAAAVGLMIFFTYKDVLRLFQ